MPLVILSVQGPRKYDLFSIAHLNTISLHSNTNCLLLLIGQSSPRVSPAAESVGIGVEDMLVIIASVNRRKKHVSIEYNDLYTLTSS